MKSVRYSRITKLLIHLVLLVSGFFILLSAFAALSCSSNYGTAKTFVETSGFEERYGKYLERMALYIQYKEQGYETEDPTYRDVDFSLPDYTYLNNENQDDKQLEFDFYNKKLNYDRPNFLYYIKNLKTNAKYYSPHLPEYTARQNSLDLDTDIDKLINLYVSNLKSSPAYFVLNTRDLKYTTNITNYGYISSTSVEWIAQCVKGNLNIPLNNGSDFVIYTSSIPDFPQENDDFSPLNRQFLSLHRFHEFSFPFIILSFLIFLAFFLLAIAVTAHVSGKRKMKLLLIDRIYTEFYILLSILIPGLIIFMFLYLSVSINTVSGLTILFPWLSAWILKSPLGTYMTALLILYVILGPVLDFLFFGVIRRLKTKTFCSGSLTVRLFKKLRKSFHAFTENKKVTYAAALYFSIIAAVLFVSAFCFYRHHLIAGTLCFLAALAFAAHYLFRLAADLNILVNETTKIAEGDLEHKIKEEELCGPMRRLGGFINHISDGLSEAVDEKLKSEHLKTELITNVSHDIKTPLTSIINYVDLLRKEKLDNPNAQKYLEVLGSKTWRLKNLIEDLVDASKASSGTVTLNIEKLNLVELLRQTLGEYDDRFQQNHLEAIASIEKDPIYIMADGRSTFRIIENLFSNVNKYALTGTRIYIDITLQKDLPVSTVSLAVKNISAHALNIPSEELMERFVRGDLARSTEGSGLGLSIAKSLAELQEAQLELFMDGDLFKAVLKFPVLSAPEHQGSAETDNNC